MFSFIMGYCEALDRQHGVGPHTWNKLAQTPASIILKVKYFLPHLLFGCMVYESHEWVIMTCEYAKANIVCAHLLQLCCFPIKTPRPLFAVRILVLLHAVKERSKSNRIESLVPFR